MDALLFCAGLYISCGGYVAFRTWEPEQGGWLWVILFWPLQLYARLS